MKARQHQQPKQETWEDANQSWIRWWKRHRDSGYVEDDRGLGRFNILPHEAFSILKYQAEFHGDHGLDWDIGKLNGQHLAEFTFEDFENWAAAQKEFEDSGGNKAVSRDSARKVVEDCFTKLHHYHRIQ